MQIRKITEGLDYGYSQSAGRDIPLGQRRLNRARIVRKGVERDVLDFGWQRRPGARKDGVVIRQYDREGNLTDRERVIPSRWVRCEWHEYDTERRLAAQRREAERNRAQQEIEQRENRRQALNARLTALGYEGATNQHWDRLSWRLDADTLTTLLDDVEAAR